MVENRLIGTWYKLFGYESAVCQSETGWDLVLTDKSFDITLRKTREQNFTRSN